MKPQLALSPELSLPLEFATRTLAIFGIRGAGKTNTASVLVEELLDRNLPTVVIDPTDAWWGLREKYPVFIFGGSHGDVPLQETDGKIVAQFIVAEKVPVILSLRHLRKGAQRRFVTDFCEELYHLKGQTDNRTSLMVVIDEAPLFVPQKVMGEIARTVGAVEDLIARGRNAGFGVTLISQRPATINKDVLTQADAIITHRITSPQDRKALGEWFNDNAGEEHADILNSLSTQVEGKAWVWAPTLGVMKQVQVRKRRTFDSSATPKIGQVIVPPKKLTEINLDVLKGKMADALKDAKENDPAALKAKIRQLEQQVDGMRGIREQTVISPLDKLQMEVIAVTGGHIADLSLTAQHLFAKVEEMRKAYTTIGVEVSKLSTARPVRPSLVTAVAPKRQATAAASSNARQAAGISGGGSLSAVDRAFLTVLAQRMGKGTTRNQLAVFAGYSATSRHVDNTISGLRTRGLLDGVSQHLMITDAGVDTLGNYEPLPSGAALVQYWVRKAGTAEGAMLAELVKCYPETMSRDLLAERTGYSVTSRHVDNTISHLRTLELVTGDRNALKASDDLVS